MTRRNASSKQTQSSLLSSKMSKSSRAISKFLIALAATMAPCQPLQSMHLFCHDRTFLNESVDEAQSQSCKCTGKSTCDTESSTFLCNAGASASPCSCPPTCTCKRPSQPRVLIREQLKIERYLTLFSQVFISTVSSLKSDEPPIEVANLRAQSAHNACVFLCRFLA